MNTNTGIVVVGSQVIGFTERLTCLRWDIPADVLSEVTCYLEDPFYLFYTTRYHCYNYILTTYLTRWVTYEVEQTPISERKVMLNYFQRERSERTYYYYPDSCERMIFVEAFYSNTPLLLKYPKYFNWNYIPQIVNPQFSLWSFYPLEVNDITLKIIGSSGISLFFNSGVSPDSFVIEVYSNKQYRITVLVDHVFDNEETVSCYLTAFDIRGNYLKYGMW